MVGNAFFIVFFLLLWHSVAIEFNSLTVSKNTQICFILCFILLFFIKKVAEVLSFPKKVCRLVPVIVKNNLI